MMGRNMWLYVLTKQIILTYIFNFIIYKINKYCHYLKQSCRIRVRNFLLMLRFGRLRNNLLYLRPNGRSGQMAVEVSRFSSFMCHVNLIELITLGTVRFMRGLQNLPRRFLFSTLHTVLRQAGKCNFIYGQKKSAYFAAYFDVTCRITQRILCGFLVKCLT